MHATGLEAQRRPELKSIVRAASNALAMLDAARLEELAASCEALNRALPPVSAQEAREAEAEMAVLGRVLEATRANMKVMERLRELRALRLEYSERQAPAWPAESGHGND